MLLQPTRLTDYSDDALLNEIRRVAALVPGPTLSIAAFDKYARVGITTVRRRFGGWREALGAAGLAHLYAPVPPARVSRTLARTLSDDELLGELRHVAEHFHSSTVTVDQFRSVASVGVDAVRRRFGSWTAAIQAAGFTTVSHGRRYTDEECYANLLVVWTRYGRPPRYQEMNTTPSTVGGKAYTVRWGTWTGAIHAFTQYVASDAPPTSPQDPPASAIPITKAAPLLPADRREPSVGLRMRVLSRDRFRCVLCGRSPATDLSCELHLDHVVPLSKGGKTTFENLRSLCKHCNLGKRDTLDV